MLKMPIRTAKIIDNESFKENDPSRAMLIAVVWFCRVHVQVFPQLSKHDGCTF